MEDSFESQQDDLLPLARLVVKIQDPQVVTTQQDWDNFYQGIFTLIKKYQLNDADTAEYTAAAIGIFDAICDMLERLFQKSDVAQQKIVEFKKLLHKDHESFLPKEEHTLLSEEEIFASQGYLIKTFNESEQLAIQEKDKTELDKATDRILAEFDALPKEKKVDIITRNQMLDELGEIGISLPTPKE